MDVALGDVALAALVANTPVALAVADESGRLAFISPALQEMLGRPFEPLHHSTWVTEYGLRAEDGVTPLGTHEVPLARALRGEVVTDAVVAVLPPHLPRITRYARCNASPVLSASGAVVGAVVLIQDVTVEKVALQTEAELRARLVETVHHHLRTPLTTIVGHLDLLQTSPVPLPAAAQRSVQSLATSAAELVRLAQELTVICELQRTSELVLTERRVSQLLGSVVAGRDDQSERDRINVYVPSDAGVVLDFDRVEQALAAIVVNAFMYAPDNASVDLAVDIDHDLLQIRVTDEGPGIDPDEWERLVQPFERGDGPGVHTERRGLGLAFAHTIARAHGGQLTSSATTGPNATRHAVTMLLPLRA